jgi:hypothetical protein
MELLTSTIYHYLYFLCITLCDEICQWLGRSVVLFQEYSDFFRQYYKIVTLGHMSTDAVERDILWVCYTCDIFISVKVSPLLCFQNSEVWILAFEEDKKTIGIWSKKSSIHKLLLCYAWITIAPKQTQLHVMAKILANTNTFCHTVPEELRSQDLQCYTV